MIAGMVALTRLTGLELGQLCLQLLPILGEFGLHLWGVLHVAMPRDDLPISSHDCLFVVLDILDRIGKCIFPIPEAPNNQG
jgi:hypothetical protein